MRNKKAQVSIFIITAVVLLATAGFYFYVNSKEAQKATETPYDFAPVKNYFEECIKSRAELGLNLMGIQGGMITLQDSYLITNYSRIAYGVYQKQNTLPSLITMEKELKSYLDKTIPSCLNSSAFPYLKFESGNASTEVKILANEVSVKAKYPISIIQGATIAKIDEFNVQVPVRLGYIHSILTKVIKRSLLEPNWVDLSYLSKFDLKIDVLPYGNYSLVYSVQDYKSAKTYIFLSAFNLTENKAPAINEENKIVMRDGEFFFKKLNVTDPENDYVECSDDTALFDISYDCIVALTPEIPGTYNTTISAIDNFGNRADKIIIFEVKK